MVALRKLLQRFRQTLAHTVLRVIAYSVSVLHCKVWCCIYFVHVLCWYCITIALLLYYIAFELYCIALYGVVLNCIALNYIALFCIVWCCIELYCIELYCTVLYCMVVYCIILFCIVSHRIVLYTIILYCIVSHCIVMHCFVLYYIVLYCNCISSDILLSMTKQVPLLPEVRLIVTSRKTLQGRETKASLPPSFWPHVHYLAFNRPY